MIEIVLTSAICGGFPLLVIVAGYLLHEAGMLR